MSKEVGKFLWIKIPFCDPYILVQIIENLHCQLLTEDEIIADKMEPIIQGQIADSTSAAFKHSIWWYTPLKLVCQLPINTEKKKIRRRRLTMLLSRSCEIMKCEKCKIINGYW